MKKLSIIIILLNINSFSYGQDTAKWVFTNYPPANYQLAGNRFSGFINDIVIEAFEERLNIAVEIAVFPWKRCQFMVENGMADMMVTIPTSQRLAYAVTHEKPIWIKKRILYTYRGHPKIDAINRLNGLADIREGRYKVVSYLGNGWVESDVQGAGISVLYASKVEGMYRMLSAKRSDLIIEEKSLATPLIKDLGLTGTLIATHGIGSESGFHILIAKKSPFASLVPQLNREIEAMRNSGEISRILKRYHANTD